MVVLQVWTSRLEGVFKFTRKIQLNFPSEDSIIITYITYITYTPALGEEGVVLSYLPHKSSPLPAPNTT